MQSVEVQGQPNISYKRCKNGLGMYVECVFFPMKDSGIPRESREFGGACGNCRRSRHRATCKPKATIEIARGNVPEPSIRRSKSREL
jgi:hypothetical protein